MDLGFLIPVIGKAEKLTKNQPADYCIFDAGYFYIEIYAAGKSRR